MNRHAQWLTTKLQRQSVLGYLHDVPALAMSALLDKQIELKIQGSLAEIGIFHGKSFIGLARAAVNDEVVLAIDPFILSNKDFSPIFYRNLKQHLNQDEYNRVQVIHETSDRITSERWRETLKQPARFVHLDGYHARTAIKYDLFLAQSYLTKGALVVLDDFLNELHPDLTVGMVEFLESGKLIPIAVIPRMGTIHEGGSKLVCCVSSEYASQYVEAIDKAFAKDFRPWQDEFLGKPIRVYRPFEKTKPKSTQPPSWSSLLVLIGNTSMVVYLVGQLWQRTTFEPLANNKK